MIIQLLGANGAGKSSIVELVMLGRVRAPVHFFGRSRPDGYFLEDVSIAGHYEGSACGGGDTLPRDRVVATVELMLNNRRPVLIEGPTGREPMFSGDVRVVYLRRSAEECLMGWAARQRAKGLSFDHATMGRRVRATITRCDNMVAMYHERGVATVTTGDRRAARAEIERLLGRK